MNTEDLIVWPDGTSCLRYELHEMTHMSDDYAVYPFESADWYAQQGIEMPPSQPKKKKWFDRLEFKSRPGYIYEQLVFN